MSWRPGCVEWATAERARPGEAVSGDLGVCVTHGDEVRLAVIDGLGHGPEAADAAATARSCVVDDPAAPAEAVLSSCHDALTGMRGATMTLVTVDCRQHRLHWVGVGDVEARLIRAGDWGRTEVVASAVLHRGALGLRLPGVRASVVDWRPDDVLVMATDGVAAGFAESVAVRQAPQRIADSLLDRYGKPSDDDLVAVARLLGGDGDRS